MIYFVTSERYRVFFTSFEDPLVTGLPLVSGACCCGVDGLAVLLSSAAILLFADSRSRVSSSTRSLDESSDSLRFSFTCVNINCYRNSTTNCLITLFKHSPSSNQHHPPPPYTSPQAQQPSQPPPVISQSPHPSQR